jgi:hypothetical protein
MQTSKYNLQHISVQLYRWNLPDNSFRDKMIFKTGFLFLWNWYISTEAGWRWAFNIHIN